MVECCWRVFLLDVMLQYLALDYVVMAMPSPLRCKHCEREYMTSSGLSRHVCKKQPSAPDLTETIAILLKQNQQMLDIVSKQQISIGRLHEDIEHLHALMRREKEMDDVVLCKKMI